MGKKFLSLLLAGAMTVSLAAGCGSQPNAAADAGNDAAVSESDGGMTRLSRIRLL